MATSEDRPPDFTTKQHDTWPPIEATLSDTNGALNLTGASVRLILKTVAGAVAVDAACSILDPLGGVVRYQWVPTDTATVATYQGEFEITWSDGKITTVPNDEYFKVVIVADLA